jgi:hypothetical protein
MAVVTRQRGFGEKLGGKILKLAVGVFTGQPGLPIAIAKELLHMSQKDVEDGRLVKDSLEKLKAGETREAVLQLVDRYGAPSIYELVSKFAADPRQFAYDALIEAVGKISDKDPETDTFG